VSDQINPAIRLIWHMNDILNIGFNIYLPLTILALKINFGKKSLPIHWKYQGEDIQNKIAGEKICVNIPHLLLKASLDTPHTQSALNITQNMAPDL
jgi:hypothetical protein